MSGGLELARSYPPAPWELRGQVYEAMWLVPREQCTVELDPAFEPLVFGGRSRGPAGSCGPRPRGRS
jgi:hypothetical protein